MSDFHEKRIRNVGIVAVGSSEIQRHHDLIMEWLAESGTDTIHLSALHNYIFDLTGVKVPTASLRNFFLDRCNQNPLVPPGGLRGKMMCCSWKKLKLAPASRRIKKKPG